MTVAPTHRRLTTQVNGADTLVTLSGDWITQDDGHVAAAIAALLDRKDLKSIAFDSGGLGRWDSSLLPQYAFVQDGYSNPQRQLRITISALDLWRNGQCVLAANWSIVDRDSSIPVTSGSGTFDSLDAGSATGVTDANRVDAVARTLGKLADSIVLAAD